MTRNTTTSSNISTLDVLCAFYQSQPKSVKKAFRSRMEREEMSATLPIWQNDLNQIKALKENWDEEGALRINRKAISFSRKIMKKLSKEASSFVRFFPTHLGAVMLKMETPNGRIIGEIGDSLVSYFIKRPNTPTEHHSFETQNKELLSSIVEHLENLK